MTFFSIVIPVFNRAQQFKRCLQSVISQSFDDFEVIVVDDGSDLDQADLIKSYIASYADQRIKLYCHNVNKNGAAARNTGIKKSTGRFICFLDSDDVWMPNKLDVLHNHIKQSSHEESLEFIHHPYINRYVDLQSEPFPQVAKENDESVTHYSFVTNNVGGIQSSTICLGANIARQVMFNESLRAHQDWDFVIRVGEILSNFTFIQEPLSIRFHDVRESVSNNINWKFSLNFYRAYKKYFSPESAAYFFVRVVLPKIKNLRGLIEIMTTSLFLKSLLRYPQFVLQSHFKISSSVFNIRFRLMMLFLKIKIRGVKSICIWGANDITEKILNKRDDKVSAVCIIDKRAGSEKFGEENTPILRLKDIEKSTLNNVDAIIISTNRFAESMLSELNEYDPKLLKKVIKL